ncbi:MAG: DNA repair protein RecN [Clostridium sp.]|nr:DNA repair protein RecN [Clostridium sp.]
MLERLIIKNIALISSLDIELGGGLNVLTGETGAGKSIIIDSVNLVLGERASKDLIAINQQKARVEALFSIKNNDTVKSLLNDNGLLSEDDELILMREITASGKSLCRINGEVVPLATLHLIADSLVDVHGQHTHQSLLDPKKHMHMVDEFNASDIIPVRNKVAELYRAYTEVERKLNSGFVSAEERERRIDILAYQINEIEKAHLYAGEEEEITAELAVLSNAERISSSLDIASDIISGDRGSLGSVRKAADALSRISDISAVYSDIYERINSLYYELEDASYQLRDLSLSFEFSPERLNELENRMDYLNSLKRKYGGSIEAVLEFMQNCKTELEELSSSDEIRERLIKELARLKSEYFEASARLTALRNQAAQALSENVTKQLHELGMANAQFTYVNNVSDEKLHINGSDSIEFMFSANAGEPCKPLAKVASGGELSRIMLAIKTVCADADAIPTLIFDEIDSGISGVTAIKVGEKMARIAASHQVLCITHLPQIAAYADSHFLVEKTMDNGETHSSLRQLGDEERRTELARIMGSVNADESAVKYAQELISASEKYKLSIS